MNILFNASQCGLGNNGGTKTIIRCAETLQDMGHNVAIWAEVNKYTWHEPKVKTLKCGVLHDFEANPNNCTMVNVSVWETVSSPTFYYNTTYWYMRGWEKWVHGEDWLIQQIKKFVSAGGRIIVNATHLKDMLSAIGVDSVVCFAGLDLNIWEDFESDNDDPPTVGAMSYSRHKTKNSDMIHRFGSYYSGVTAVADIKDGLTYSDLMRFYSQCDIWFAPTELEGWHNCPTEANLCGCLVVCNRMPSNGMGDYATEETAMRYDNWEELIECIENPDFSKVPKMQDVLKNKIGNREKNMKKFVEILEG